ncbi:hypothetical protein [Candidatus Phytoplasma sp. AldY-WA1]|uniref:hypothetical protein n=1 Tax=Candidatus Phytoplasma sp. AldY-WA1 TaxID=2852100 RepID=UPI00254F0A00|nr:hypothetical protein [Candidatus Phytoplasma sp. AldY-WA1]
MNKKKLIKDIIFFWILTFIFIIGSFGHKIENKSTFISVIINISTFLSGLMVIGLFCYIGFKIMKGKTIIYKDPNKAKTLDNIDFVDTLPDGKSHSKTIKYSEHFPLTKNYFLRKFMIFFTFLLLLVIILFMINIFYKSNYNINYYKIFNKLLILLFVLLLLLAIYIILEFYSDLWCFYVKFFKWLGIFSFLEKDFNKTVNSHNYFIISIFYYEKQKKQTKQTKLNYILRWFILIFIAILFLWFIDKLRLNIKKK